MEDVTLRNGAVVPDVLLKTTTHALHFLHRKGEGVALYELNELAHNPDHQMFGNSAEVLEANGLLQRGRLHDAVRDIVLASFTGSGLNLGLVSPVN